MASTITEEITKQIESYQNLKSSVTKHTTNKTTPNIHPTNIQNRKRKTTKEHPKGSKQLTLDYF